MKSEYKKSMDRVYLRKALDILSVKVSDDHLYIIADAVHKDEAAYKKERKERRLSKMIASHAITD